jgi:hypothetical protein
MKIHYKQFSSTIKNGKPSFSMVYANVLSNNQTFYVGNSIKQMAKYWSELEVNDLSNFIYRKGISIQNLEK